MKRIPGLDVLRGIAILMVVVHHTIFGYAFPSLGPIASRMTCFGWTGVDLFFVLSGFLVGSLLMREIRETGDVQIQRFYGRRALKIWPAYFVFIGFVGAKILKHGAQSEVDLTSLWPNLVHIQNYFPTKPAHTWSLAVEEHFYLMLPVLCVLLNARGGRGHGRMRLLPRLAVFVLLICLALRCITNLDRSWLPVTHLFPTHLRMDSLFVGVAIAYLAHFRRGFIDRCGTMRGRLLLVGLVMIGPMLFLPQDHPFTFTIGYTLLAVGYGLVVLSVVSKPEGDVPEPSNWKNWIGRPLARIGVLSYSIYLWHMDFGLYPAAFWAKPLWASVPAEWQWSAYAWVSTFFAVISGIIMAKIVEFPCLRFRERFLPAKPRRIMNFSFATSVADDLPKVV